MHFMLCHSAGRITASTLLILSGCLAIQPAALADGTISGQIRDLSTKAPIPFANIFISGCAELNALEDGAYIVDCPPGTEYQIEINANGYEEKQIGPITIEDNSFVQQNIFLNRQVDQQADNDQDNSANESSQYFQDNDENPAQEAKPLSEQALYFAKRFANIATERIQDRRARKDEDAMWDDGQDSFDQGYDASTCDALIQNGNADEIYNNYCDDCSAIIKSGNSDLISEFGCLNDSTGWDETSSQNSCDELIKEGDAQAIYDNYCDNCSAIVSSGNPELIEYFECETQSGNQTAQNTVSNTQPTSSPNKNQASNTTTQGRVSIRNRGSITKLISGGPEVKLKLTGKYLKKLTSVIVIFPNGKKTLDISARLAKKTSKAGRYVYLKGSRKAKSGDGYYRLVALAGKKALTLDQKSIRIIVKR